MIFDYALKRTILLGVGIYFGGAVISIAQIAAGRIYIEAR